MDCVYFEKLIYRLPDGDLTDAEQAELRAHIDACEDCRTLYEAVTAAHEFIVQPEAVPESFCENVMAAVRAEEKAQKAREERIRRNTKLRQRWRFGDLGLIAACLALVVVTANVLFGDLGQNKTADTAEAAPMMMEEAIAETAAEADTTAADGGTPVEYAAGSAVMEGAEPETNGSDAASMAREAADEDSAAAAVYAPDGSYLGTLADETLAALLSDGGSTAETDTEPGWTMQVYDASYELFVLDGALFWRETGSETLTASALAPSAFEGAIE